MILIEALQWRLIKFSKRVIKKSKFKMIRQVSKIRNKDKKKNLLHQMSKVHILLQIPFEKRKVQINEESWMWKRKKIVLKNLRNQHPRGQKIAQIDAKNKKSLLRILCNYWLKVRSTILNEVLAWLSKIG